MTTITDAPPVRSLRDRVRALVETKPFQRSIIGLILVNAVILGLETYPAVMDAIGHELELLNTVIIVVFVAELVLRIWAYGWRFFTNGWNIFDFFVVVVALIPAGAEAGVLRVLRLLRVRRRARRGRRSSRGCTRRTRPCRSGSRRRASSS